MELSFFEILLYAFAIVFSIAVVVLTFKLIALCDKFDELLKIYRRQAGVREYNGKLHPIDEDGNIINSTKK
jgi:hypothetical protein